MAIGLALVFPLDTGWLMAVGPALMGAGGFALALAAEPLVDHTPQNDDTVNAPSRRGGKLGDPAQFDRP